jgi:hypothetical protein
VGKPLLFNSILKHNITIIEDKIVWFLIFNFVVCIDIILSYLSFNQMGPSVLRTYPKSRVLLSYKQSVFDW